MMARQPRRFNMELLERREVFSATAIEVEPNNSRGQATPAAFDTADGRLELRGTSAQDSDKDFFVVTSPGSGQLFVSVGATVGGNVAKLQVENLAGVTLAETDPNDGVNSAVLSVAAGQRLFVRMRSPNNAPASYAARLSLGSPWPNGGGGGGNGPIVAELEGNNTRGSATPFSVAMNATVRLTGTSRNSADKDFFAFTPAVNAVLTVSANTTNQNMPAVQIENRLGVRVFETDPNRGINSGTVALVAGDKYFVRVRSKNGSASAYHVDVTLSPATGGRGTAGQPTPGSEIAVADAATHSVRDGLFAKATRVKFQTI